MTVPRATAEDERGTLTRRIANERIAILFRLAKENVEGKPELANDYAKLIRDIAMHYRIKLPGEISAMICRGCGAFLVPGKSASVRVVARDGYNINKCLACGRERKVYYHGRIRT